MIDENSQSIKRKSQRKYPRADYSTPIRYKRYVFSPDEAAYDEAFTSEGKSANISPGGILLQTRHKPPKLSDVIWLNLDMKTVKTLTLCLEPGERPLILNDGLIGKVAHVEEDPSQEMFNVGIEFLAKLDTPLP